MKYAVIVGLVVLAPELAEAKCPKWDSRVAQCDLYPAHKPCNSEGEELSFGQRQHVADVLFSDTAEEACAKSWDYHATQSTSMTKVQSYNPNNPVLKQCCVLWNNDPSIGWICQGDVELKQMGEPECEMADVVAGPYTDNPHDDPRPAVTPVPGGDFGVKPKEWMVAENVLTNDAEGPYPRPASDWPRDYAASYRRATLELSDDPVPTGYDDTLQVDHILPRVDIYHCPCGTNGYNNMLLISGRLNREMSNDLKDPTRIAILQKYVPGYVPPASLVAPDEVPQVAEVEGGCSTGPATPAWLAVLGLGFVVLRRRGLRA